jgi:general secretion pathway protein D
MAGGAWSGGTYRGGTLGGLGLGQAGFSLTLRNPAGEIRAALNALASDNRANILSSPRVMARNGETATIQVGQEVPIITSQATGLTTGANSGQVLQTIQYRSTGVILRVKPVIHSSDQIDLDVLQEVSGAQQTETGVNASPTFSSRKLETKLTMQNGTTVLLGGLISEERNSGVAGVPLLKDIPGVGALFSKQSSSGRRRELVVLITPYVVASNREAEELTRAFRSMLQPWARTPAGAPAPGSAPAPAPAVMPATVPASAPAPAGSAPSPAPAPSR